MATELKTTSRTFSVRETVLTDGSLVYDVLVDGVEFYNAQNEADAYAFESDLRDVICRYEGETASVRAKASGELWQRLNALSYRFPFDSYGARTLSEAADVVKGKVAR